MCLASSFSLFSIWKKKERSEATGGRRTMYKMPFPLASCSLHPFPPHVVAADDGDGDGSDDDDDDDDDDPVLWLQSNRTPCF